MEEVWEFAPGTPAHWAKLKAASPETWEASKKHWYTIPTASKSGFYESELPDHAALGWDVVMDEFIRTHTSQSNTQRRHAPSLAGLELSFIMCQLAQSTWYAHMSLPELAAEAEQFIEGQRPNASERLKVWRNRLQPHPTLLSALDKGMDSVYTLAALSPSLTRVAQMVMKGDTPDQITQAMGYKPQVASSRIAEINKKLRNLLKEEV